MKFKKVSLFLIAVFVICKFTFAQSLQNITFDDTEFSRYHISNDTYMFAYAGWNFPGCMIKTFKGSTLIETKKIDCGESIITQLKISKDGKYIAIITTEQYSYEEWRLRIFSIKDNSQVCGYKETKLSEKYNIDIKKCKIDITNNINEFVIYDGNSYILVNYINEEIIKNNKYIEPKKEDGYFVKLNSFDNGQHTNFTNLEIGRYYNGVEMGCFGIQKFLDERVLAIIKGNNILIQRSKNQDWVIFRASNGTYSVLKDKGYEGCGILDVNEVGGVYYFNGMEIKYLPYENNYDSYYLNDDKKKPYDKTTEDFRFWYKRINISEIRTKTLYAGNLLTVNWFDNLSNYFVIDEKDFASLKDTDEFYLLGVADDNSIVGRLFTSFIRTSNGETYLQAGIKDKDSYRWFPFAVAKDSLKIAFSNEYKKDLSPIEMLRWNISYLSNGNRKAITDNFNNALDNFCDNEFVKLQNIDINSYDEKQLLKFKRILSGIMPFYKKYDVVVNYVLTTLSNISEFEKWNRDFDSYENIFFSLAEEYRGKNWNDTYNKLIIERAKYIIKTPYYYIGEKELRLEKDLLLEVDDNNYKDLIMELSLKLDEAIANEKKKDEDYKNNIPSKPRITEYVYVSDCESTVHKNLNCTIILYGVCGQKNYRKISLNDAVNMGYLFQCPNCYK